MTIPASQIANVIPGVLSPGGAGLVMNGLVLTENVLMPTGTVRALPAHNLSLTSSGRRPQSMPMRLSISRAW